MTQSEACNSDPVNSSMYEIPESELRYYEAHADFLDHVEGIELELTKADREERARINRLPNSGALKSRFAEFDERRELEKRVQSVLAEVALSKTVDVE